MIPLEQQVCSLELAKRLKELGVKQESLFHWQPSYYDRKTMVVVAENAEDWSDDVESYSAFTVAELGEMLPKEATSSWKYFPDDVVMPKGWRWKCFYHGDELERIWADTEADACSKLLIYLVENKLVTL